MNLFRKLQQRQAEGRPLRVGLIGAGKFGAMYLAQVPKTPGVHLAGIADLALAPSQGPIWSARSTLSERATPAAGCVRRSRPPTANSIFRWSVA